MLRVVGKAVAANLSPVRDAFVQPTDVCAIAPLLAKRLHGG